MNTELIMNSYTTPVYVTTTNMVVPIVSISLTSLDRLLSVALPRLFIIVGNFVAIMQSHANIWASTIYFILEQLIIEISNVMTNVDKVLLVFSIYNIVMFAYKNYKLNIEVKNLKLDVEQLEKNISYLKKAEGMRENLQQIWSEEVRQYYNEHNNKYKEVNRNLKKIKKEMNEYI